MKKERIVFYLLLLVYIPFLSNCSDSEDDIIPHIELSDTDFFYKSIETDTRKFTLEANVDWKLTISDKENTSGQKWLSASHNSGQAGAQEIRLYVSGTNNSTKARTATVEIIGAEITKIITVKQNGKATIDLEKNEYIIKELESAEIKFSIDDNWTITPSSVSWGVFSQTSGNAGNHIITFTPKDKNNSINDVILEGFIISDGISKAFTITHKAGLELYKDKDVVQLQTATKGIGVDLIFMGDGFTKKDLVKGSGKYETAIKQAIEHFFSIEPYTSYRDYFNAYMVVAESAEEGVKNEFGDVNNKFSSTYGSGTAISCNNNLCREYVALVTEYKGEESTNYGNLTAIMILNSSKYAGTCTYWSDGFSIAKCPMSTRPSPYDYRGLVNHEAGGHGFGMLADEYVNSANKYSHIPPESINDGLNKRSWGRHFNIDFTSNLAEIQWSDFINHPKYPMVNAFEGGFYYGYGVWRPEEGSCMINNIHYYNAPSRYAIVKRIMKINNIILSFNDFVNGDIIDMQGLHIARTKGKLMEMPPLAPPVFVE